MALFHLTVTQTKRSAGQSAIASAAYRSGEKPFSEYYGEYTRKGGVICSDILLPPHAPQEYQDRQTLWNAVEKAERGGNAQLAYSFDIALQNEFSLEENIALARQFLSEHFVSRGMTVDVSFHEKEHGDGGTPKPHFHFLCPIRPLDESGKWGKKQRRVYRLDEGGNCIMGKDGKPLFDAVPTTDWDDPATLEAGVGHLLDSSLPVGGESTHCVLTGHSGTARQKLFSDLDALAVGDLFYLNVLGQRLAYQVDQIKTVLPEDTTYLSIVPGEDLCTLVTCTPFGVNTHRLLVRGTRIFEEAVETTALIVLLRKKKGFTTIYYHSCKNYGTSHFLRVLSTNAM